MLVEVSGLRHLTLILSSGVGKLGGRTGECESTGQSRKANAGSEPSRKRGSVMSAVFRSGDLNLLFRPSVVGKMLSVGVGLATS